MSLRHIIFLILGLYAGCQVGLDAADSEPAFTMLLVYGIIFLGPFIGVGWLVWGSWQPPSKERWYLRILRLFIMVLAIIGAHAFGSWRVCPSHIRYEFDYSVGASSTWHEVQFHHLENGQWIQGPRVYAWPMAVSFPDLNHDGHRDIEVTGHGRVTFLYLPQNNGRQYWQLHEREGSYDVSYAPAGIMGSP